MTPASSATARATISASTLPAATIDAFYRAAHLGLRALDAQGGRRRFDSDADARWRLFRGHLEETDRLDLLLRDAAAAHPAAFAPRDIFELDGLAGDEPFGPDWPGADPLTADELRRVAGQPLAEVGLGEILRQSAACWEINPSPLTAIAALTPASRVLAAGAGAVIALAEHFEGRAGYDLAEQVALVTQEPGERQLFGLAVTLLNSFQAVRFIAPHASAAELRAAGLARIDQIVISPDAPPACREAAQRLGHALGAP